MIDPPDGKVPPLTAEARARLSARNLDARDHPADGPENRSLQERCLAFNAGPPIGLGPYNNFLQIFQTRDAVVIYTEMIHDARIVWTDGRPHAPPQLRRWLGDSRGRWEGKTLVVDTTNFTDKNPFRGSGENLHLTERFTRADANTLLYEFTVDDPSTFTRPWTAQIADGEERRTALRVRLPRRQLRAPRHSPRRAISGEERKVVQAFGRGLSANSPLGCSAKRRCDHELDRLRARAGARSRPPARGAFIAAGLNGHRFSGDTGSVRL